MARKPLFSLFLRGFHCFAVLSRVPCSLRGLETKMAENVESGVSGGVRKVSISAFFWKFSKFSKLLENAEGARVSRGFQ